MEPQYDFSQICRACKHESDKMQPIFPLDDFMYTTSEAISPSIIEMLVDLCTSLKIEYNDGLPHVICLQCYENLKIAFYFKRQCVQSDRELREHAKAIKVNQIKAELQNASQLFVPAPIEPEFVAKAQNADPLSQADYIEFSDTNQMILTCRECGKAYGSIDGLKVHKRAHSGILYKCRHCDKGFTRLAHALRHELTHEKHKIHICKICKKTITRADQLKRHLVTHLKAKPFACHNCNRGFNRPDHLENHAARCKGDRLFICDVCNRGFAREDSLGVHKAIHENQTPFLPSIDDVDNFDEYFDQIDFNPNSDYSTGSELDDYVESSNCEEMKHDDDILTNCNDLELQSELNRYLQLRDLTDIEQKAAILVEPKPPPKKRTRTGKEAKKKRRKRTQVIKAELASSDEENETKDEQDGVYPCSHCEETFKRVSELEKHSLALHNDQKNYACRICNRKFLRFAHLKRHMGSHQTVRPYSCEFCGVRFARKDNLQQHLRVHERKDHKMDFECELCSKSFYLPEQLAQHKLAEHQVVTETNDEKIFPIKKFECTICNKTFTTEKYRDMHVRGHMGGSTFQCTKCGKNFLSKSHLTEHMKFHNEHAKKFLCSECGQRFIRNDYLVIHMRRHRGEKPFKCRFCGKGFPRTTDLTVHERYHTGEKTHLCTVCGRGFGRAYNLTVHMRTHTGEKPYQCSFCEAAFAQGNDLKAHIRRHTGERFKCDLCTESFLMGYLLTQHKRSFHGMNVVSNIRRLQPAGKAEELDGEPPITIPLPKPEVPTAISSLQVHLVPEFINTD